MGVELWGQGPLPDPNMVFQYGATGALVFCIILMGVLGKFLLSRSDVQAEKRDQLLAGAMDRLTAATEKSFSEMATKMNEGFDAIKEALDERQVHDRQLFDKNLDVVVKVTESLAVLGTRITDNTREIGQVKLEVTKELTDLKAEVREIKNRVMK